MPLFRRSNHYSGFTLIELLIVVAIIAILAAIAVPNFLEAQTRARVSRVQSDMRTIATAMESYYVDNQRYPASPLGIAMVPVLLTTPIAYLTSIPMDTFRDAGGSPTLPWGANYLIYNVGYRDNGQPTFDLAYPRISWMTWSFGPDRLPRAGGYRTLPRIERNEGTPDPAGNREGLRYDPTNGTISDGDIYRFSAKAERREI